MKVKEFYQLFYSIALRTLFVSTPQNVLEIKL